METETTPRSDAALVAELNDLMKLDHDAVHAYNLAIRALSNEDYKRQLGEFRADHQRHIEELTTLIKSRDGVPVHMPHTSGVFKLLVQAVGAAGDDRSVLLAFKANERGSRDRYRAAAHKVHPADVTSVLARAAEDEARHYAWALETLEDLGVNFETSATGRFQESFETGHAKLADAMERGERAAFDAGERARRAVGARAKDTPLATALIAAGIGFVAATLLGGSRQR